MYSNYQTTISQAVRVLDEAKGGRVHSQGIDMALEVGVGMV